MTLHDVTINIDKNSEFAHDDIISTWFYDVHTFFTYNTLFIHLYVFCVFFFISLLWFFLILNEIISKGCVCADLNRMFKMHA